MLLGGLWHGAGWTFVVWGCLHGSYLMINHAWQYCIKLLPYKIDQAKLYTPCCWLLTFLAVVISWVFFRAPTLDQAIAILSAMIGQNGFELPSGILARLGEFGDLLSQIGIGANYASGSQLLGNIIWIFLAGSITFFTPNVAQLFNRANPVLYETDRAFGSQRSAGKLLQWSNSNSWATASGLLFLFGILTLTQISEFLYFQF